MKKIAAALALVSAGTMILAGCGSSTSPNAADATGKVSLTYLTLWPAPQVAVFQKAVNQYEKLHPNVAITIRSVPFGNLLSTITTDSLSSNGPTMFDIYDLWLPSLAKDGIVAAAPSGYASDISANYGANIVSSTDYKSATYGYPNEVDDYALDYNKALFRQAGIQSPPRTWTQLITDAKALTKYNSSGQISQQGFGLITSWNSGVVHPWLAMVQSDGGHLLNSNHQPQLTSSASEAVTKLYSNLVTKYKVTSPAMSVANASTTGPYLNNFAAGKTGMIIMADWWESDLQSSMGSKFSDVGVAPIPVGPNGTGSHTVYYSWMSTVNAHATSAQQKAAWAFLRWVNSPASGSNGSSAMGNLLASEGIMPSRNSDISAQKARLTTPFMKPYVQALKTAYPFPVVFGGDQLTTDVQNALESVIYGQSSPSDALKSGQTTIAELLSQYYGG